jgi:hypothetical protein
VGLRFGDRFRRHRFLPPCERTGLSRLAIREKLISGFMS